MYYVMRASAPSLHRESTDSQLIIIFRKAGLIGNQMSRHLFVCIAIAIVQIIISYI